MAIETNMTIQSNKDVEISLSTKTGSNWVAIEIWQQPCEDNEGHGPNGVRWLLREESLEELIRALRIFEGLSTT